MTGFDCPSIIQPPDLACRYDLERTKSPHIRTVVNLNRSIRKTVPCDGPVLVKEQLNGLSGTALSFD